MYKPKKTFVIAGATLALFLALSASPGEAEARHRWRRGGSWLGFALGAVTGAAVHGWFHHAPHWYGYEYHQYPAPPPPPPPPPAYGYGYGPPPSAPPPPVAVQPGYRYTHYQWPDMGLSVSGLVESPQTGQLPLGGVAAALQFRTSARSLMSLELQSMGARRLSDDVRRSDVGGLVSGRVFLWNAAFAPYLELAGGLGRASLRESDLEVHAVQLLGRLGVGIELRLGRHVVLDGQIAQMHRLGFDEPVGAGPLETHERATHVRGGLAFRF